MTDTIDNLTIKQARERLTQARNEVADLSALFGQAEVTAPAPTQYPIGQKVIIRARDAGVHFGTLQSVDGRTVRLTDSRRMWRWWSAGSETTLSGVARHGLAKREEVKIAGVVADQTILDACEIITMTPVAVASLENAEVARA